MPDQFGEELRRKREAEEASAARRQGREDMIRATHVRVIDGAVAEVTRFFGEDPRVKESFGRVEPATFNGDHTRFRVEIKGTDVIVVVEGTASHNTSVNPLGHMTNQVLPVEFEPEITIRQLPNGHPVAVDGQFRVDGGAVLNLYTALRAAVA